MLYTFFQVISRRLNLDAGELPGRKHTIFLNVPAFIPALDTKSQNGYFDLSEA
jgi:hypothetical protein